MSYSYYEQREREQREQREELLIESDRQSSSGVDALSLDSVNHYIQPSYSSITGSYSAHGSTLSTAMSSDEELSDSDDETDSIASNKLIRDDVFDIRDTDTDVEVVVNDNILQSYSSRQYDTDALKKSKNKGSILSKGKYSLKKRLPKFLGIGENDSCAQSEVSRMKIDRYAVRSNRDRYCIEGMEDLDSMSFNSDGQKSRFDKPEIHIQVVDDNNSSSYDADILSQWFTTNFDFDILDQSKNISDYLSGQNFDFGIVKTLEDALEATTIESNHMYSDFVGSLEENLATLQSAVDSVQQSLFTLNDTIGVNESTGVLETAEIDARYQIPTIPEDKPLDQVSNDAECEEEDFEIGLRQCSSSRSQDEDQKRTTDPDMNCDSTLSSSKTALASNVKSKKQRFSMSRLQKGIRKKITKIKGIAQEDRNQEDRNQ